MSSVLDAPSGSRTPRRMVLPEGAVSTAGLEAVELAQIAGLQLDPWQQLCLVHSLAERHDHTWAAHTVGLIVPRQNGKSVVIEARALAGLLLLDETLIYSAHLLDTSLEVFSRLEDRLDASADLSSRVKKINRSHGTESITMRSGARIQFRTRTKSGGRGFGADVVFLDEAMELPEASVGALMPTLSARPNPQLWLAGSAVDQTVHVHGRSLARIRARAMSDDPGRLAYFEFSAADDLDDVDVDLVIDDEDAWREGNPSFGDRIGRESVAAERALMDPRTFCVERLGIGDWPSLDDVDPDAVITVGGWNACRDELSTIVDVPVLTLDVTPSQDRAAIAAAGTNADSLVHGEIVDHRPGTAWTIDRCRELCDRHAAVEVLVDGKSPAAALIPRLENAGVRVRVLTWQDVTLGCTSLVDMVRDQRVVHLGTRELLAAIKGADRRGSGDQWAWSRTKSTCDISPLIAFTNAVYAASRSAPQGEVIAFRL